ncbi:4-hydroxybenzoate octaprenyltransferase [Candidatus Pelagibacter sp.]|jgi:4-hydroxybenzoate polyprenyl transferase|nr:4-hydroxybenzoate octaprenyltransferase [Candidatus Pelagibacter sp.]MDA9681103.1 4-hydroxybenzoate octaprenyltransferase [Candidatus Pelagibacter sp.]MDA9681118.1 4-hydroxybenzoate octaprenyltransferase [Candidatus Pelagibacter sp.]
MNQINVFIELTRLKRPIGFMLLFWPCLWGLTLVYDFNSNLFNYFFYSALFLSGSILMRSAGCIVNDIADKNFDQKVERTKNRPIASGKVSVKLASTYALILCGIAFLVLINFNKLTILMALISMPLAFTYPLMKRITYWPQLFLGITFNYGLVLAWISISGEISIIPIIFYLGAIFWTLGYDTIYGFQDIKDDEIIGVKSTSIKFKNDPKKFLFISYCMFIISLFLIGILMNFKMYYFLFMIVPILHLLVFQISRLNTNLSLDCLIKFKSNNILGLIIFTNILVGKLI